MDPQLKALRRTVHRPLWLLVPVAMFTGFASARGWASEGLIGLLAVGAFWLRLNDKIDEWWRWDRNPHRGADAS
jgi:hypothetical protein